MVQTVSNMAEFNSEINCPKLTVVDFFATWCGPCKAIAPFIEEMAVKYPDVKFIKVDVDQAKDVAAACSISAMPTFHYYVKGQQIDMLKGASSEKIESLILKHRQVSFDSTQGYKLSSYGNSDPNVPALSAREARLLAFSKLEGERKPVTVTEAKPSSSSSACSSASGSMGMAEGDIDEDEVLAKALAISLTDEGSAASASAPPAPVASKPKASAQDDADFAAAMAEMDAADALAATEAMKDNIVKADTSSASNFEGVGEDEEMVPVPVNEGLLQQLVEMGFKDARSRKSLVHGGSLDGALAWLTEHQDDPDIDQPYMVRKSDTIPKPPLTEEERLRRVELIKERVTSRKIEREKQDKANAIKSEKERRERGQLMEQTQEERARLARKREAEKMKKEKADAEKERQRLRAEIARDKELRRANKGVLPSVLGVDGYNPSIGDKSAPSLVPAKRDAADEKKVPPPPLVYLELGK